VESPKEILIAEKTSASPEDRLIVALDFPSGAEAMAFVGRLQGACRWFKVGMELYYAAGNQLVETLRSKGFEVFLDLKLHDIPNTVAGGVRSVGGMGASLLTVHAGGGRAMLEAAAEAAQAPGAPRLLAVTVLTSMDAGELAGVGVSASPAEQALRLARLARAAGIDGMVCSAEEVGTLRGALGDEVLLVTPGIRSADDSVDDQRRVVTPKAAIEAGSSMLVVGRPITRASDPAAAARRILDEIRRATPPPPSFAQNLRR
jgi:orotidine-5'-phosphate decarboxylase